jgi:hypothetical protein
LGHRCRYLLHDPRTGNLIREISAQLPPTLDFGEMFKAFHLPTTFQVRSPINYPIVALPPGIYRPATEWYAILFSGASMNRHMNDLEFLYRTLVHFYRIPASKHNSAEL